MQSREVTICLLVLIFNRPRVENKMGGWWSKPEKPPVEHPNNNLNVIEQGTAPVQIMGGKAIILIGLVTLAAIFYTYNTK